MSTHLQYTPSIHLKLTNGSNRTNRLWFSWIRSTPEDCAAMRAFYANRLASPLKNHAIAAETKGLTGAELERLLADES